MHILHQKLSHFRLMLQFASKVVTFHVNVTSRVNWYILWHNRLVFAYFRSLWSLHATHGKRLTFYCSETIAVKLRKLWSLEWLLSSPFNPCDKTSSRTSMLIQIRERQRCPYYRGRVHMKVAFHHTKRTVRKRGVHIKEVSVRSKSNNSWHTCTRSFKELCDWQIMYWQSKGKLCKSGTCKVDDGFHKKTPLLVSSPVLVTVRQVKNLESTSPSRFPLSGSWTTPVGAKGPVVKPQRPTYYMCVLGFSGYRKLETLLSIHAQNRIHFSLFFSFYTITRICCHPTGRLHGRQGGTNR